MPNTFSIEIPTENEVLPFSFDLAEGESVFVLGSNGSGKSALMTNLAAQHQENCRRISAQRQMWFVTNTLDYTPLNRDNLFSNIRSRDSQADSRWREQYSEERASIAIYDLIDSAAQLDRAIAGMVRDKNISEAEKKASEPSPLQEINLLMRLSNLPIEILIEPGQKVMAKKNNSSSYSVAELSDGERNAFLIAANVLTSPASTLLLIDEPERHLHRSIISPLLTQLFKKRKDCAFIIATHEIMLPVDYPTAQTLLIRSCKFEGRNPVAWTVDLLPAGTDVAEDVKKDILGSRRQIVFVEGTASSLDLPLYALLLPNISLIPKGTSREVGHAVESLRENADTHWVSAWGIIDKDQRDSETIEQLRQNGVYALPHYSVEALYYHPHILQKLSERRCSVVGGDAATLVTQVIERGLAEVEKQRDHLVAHITNYRVRRDLMEGMPSPEVIRDEKMVQLSVDTDQIRNNARKEFDDLLKAKDFNGILERYPVRESGALSGISRMLGMTQDEHEAAVRKLLIEDSDSLLLLRNLLGDLPQKLGVPDPMPQKTGRS